MKLDIKDKIVWPPDGRYVVALSGGPDSVALLDLLAGQAADRALELEVAHFDHGWGPQSRDYAALAERVAGRYGLPFHIDRRKVVRREAEAREARYRFLREVMGKIGADAIITAHHQDDLVETMVMNLRRGTRRRGLSPFINSADVIRPLVAIRKAELLAYAHERGLEYYDDVSNDDLGFRRNAVRQELARGSEDVHAAMVAIAKEATELNRRVDAGLAELHSVGPAGAVADVGKLRRLPLATLQELLVAMARAVQPGAELDRLAVEQLALDLKTGRLQRGRRLTKRLFVSPVRGRVTIVFTA